jgi:hypothetical protein
MCSKLVIVLSYKVDPHLYDAAVVYIKSKYGSIIEAKRTITLALAANIRSAARSIWVNTNSGKSKFTGRRWARVRGNRVIDVV